MTVTKAVEKDTKEREIIKWEVEHELKEPPFTLYKIFRAKKFHGKPTFVEAGEFKVNFHEISIDKCIGSF